MNLMPDADAARRQIDSWAEEARAQQRRATALSSAVSAVQVERWSPARDVRVVVGADGLLRDLELTERALGASSLQLGRLIVSTLAAARADLAVRLGEVVDDVLGSADPLAGSFRSQHVAALLEAVDPPSSGAPRPLL
jgi:hypothetical protein